MTVRTVELSMISYYKLWCKRNQFYLHYLTGGNVNFLKMVMVVFCFVLNAQKYCSYLFHFLSLCWCPSNSSFAFHSGKISCGNRILCNSETCNTNNVIKLSCMQINFKNHGGVNADCLWMGCIMRVTEMLLILD